MADIPHQLPAIPKEWHEALEENDLAGKTVHAAELASASKMNFGQFLLLRILWKVHPKEQMSNLSPVLKPHVTQANKLLAGFKPWTNYCSSIRGQEIPEGSFAIARHYQIKVTRNKGNMRPDTFDTPIAKNTRSHASKNLLEEFRKLQLKTPSKDPVPTPRTADKKKPTDDDSVLSDDSEESEEPSAPVTPAALVPDGLHRLMFPPTKDEQIVNTALVVFLNALTIHFPIIKHCDWTLHRKAFIAKFDAAQYEARTDGYLDDGNENPWALIEVKPTTRAIPDQSKIQVQEGAQMSGWIKEDIAAPLNKLRVHVSQNRHEIFTTIAEYDSGYLSYLRKKPADGEPPSFLTMHQYGPWNTQHAGHMKALGPILLALTLYAEAEVQKSRA